MTTETTPIPAEVPTPVKAPAKKVSVAKRVASDVAGVESAAEKIAAAVEFDLHKGITDVVTEAKKEVGVAEKAAPGLLAKLKASLAPNLVHYFGLLGTIGTVFTHDLTKAENVVAPLVGLGVTTAIKKISAAIK
jgi:hypothetical protein